VRLLAAALWREACCARPEKNRQVAKSAKQWRSALLTGNQGEPARTVDRSLPGSKDRSFAFLAPSRFAFCGGITGKD